VLGWRTPPQNKDELGDKARLMRPSIRQLLFARPSGMDADAYERALYLTRKLIVKRCAEAGITEEPVYIVSCSHRTIVYKALCLPTALAKFYEDLENPDYQTGLCLFHQRFSTNTFPTWPLAHPFSMLCHNGEINTVKGNRNWMRSRETDFESPLWGADVASLAPVCDPRESDSASLNAALELLVLSGRSPEQALALLVPPAYGIDPFTSEAPKKRFTSTRKVSPNPGTARPPWSARTAAPSAPPSTATACARPASRSPATA
jgi:glutamate synthase domain-containing protein 1